MIKLSFFKYLLPVSLFPLFCACTQDIDDASDEVSGNDVLFGAAVFENNDSIAVNTRAAAGTTFVELDGIEQWGYFYIYMSVDGGDYSKFGTYSVPSGVTAQLDYIDKSVSDAVKLNWKNSTSTHQFISWNIPMTSSVWKLVVMNKDANGNTDNTTGTVLFACPDKRGSGDYVFSQGCNNWAGRTSYLVGTKTDNVTYKDNGSSVKMIYDHLTTKVQFRNITLTESDGSIKILRMRGDSRAIAGNPCIEEIKFVDMPYTGILHTGINSNEFPWVEPNKEETRKGVLLDYLDKGSKYFIFNFPPFDFETYGRFEVTVSKQEGEYTTYHKYYGTLSDLIGNEKLEGRTGLNGGDYLIANLRLEDGKVTGISAYIAGWSEVALGTMSVPVKKGVYTLDDLSKLYSSKDASVWESYADENGVVHIYDNINNTNSDATINIPDGFTIDGMGHNIYGKTVAFVPASKVKDLYINDEYVYGDESGQPEVSTFADFYNLVVNKAWSSYADENNVVHITSDVTIDASYANVYVEVPEGYTLDGTKADGSTSNITAEGGITIYGKGKVQNLNVNGAAFSLN